MKKWVWWALTMSSAILIAGSCTKVLPIGLTEVLGFISGALCVLLIVEENVWNFPVGIVNNIFFIALFLTAKLYGDMGLQFIYIILAFQGWYLWLYGGKNRTTLEVSNTPIREAIVLAVVGIISTWLLWIYLASIKDVAPFLDSLTTVLSLIAQYMLNKKRIQNWYVWITADVIYIGLYIYKDLGLTAILYTLFIWMCVAGLRSWQRSYQKIA